MSRVYIIDKNNLVHMAHIDIHYGFSGQRRGCASIQRSWKAVRAEATFYEIYPEKFNNKTNGITFRRWLLHCNHELDGVHLKEPDRRRAMWTDASQLEKLLAYQR